MTPVEFILQNRPYFEDFITRSVYHSNAIEGSTLSYAETYAIIWNDNDFKVRATARELYEAINLKYAMSYIIDNAGNFLTEKMIIHIGVLINRNIDEIDGYRTIPVQIRGAEHIPPAPELVRNAMMYFVYNYYKTEYDSVFDRMADTHIQFERIHPFSDGNGGTGRALLSFELLNNGYLPIVIPKDDRTEYFDYLAQQNRGGLADYFRKLHDREIDRAKNFGYDFQLNHERGRGR